MPYPANSDLPASVQEHLPPHAQDIYREAFNHAFRHPCRRSAPGRGGPPHCLGGGQAFLREVRRQLDQPHSACVSPAVS